MNIQTTPISLDHQNALSQKFIHLDPFISEYSFANLFLFANIHQYRVITLKNELFISGLTRSQKPYIMPTSYPQNSDKVSFEQVLNITNALFPIPSTWFDTLPYPIKLASFQDADTDYLFAIEKLATLKGRHLDGPRGLIRKLQKEHSMHVKNIDDYLEEASDLLKNWERGTSLNQTDADSCYLAIKYFEKLHLTGLIAFADGVPCGFIIGEWISKNCFAAHFAKTNTSIHGITPYLYQQLATSLMPQKGFINLGPDLGILTLKNAKLAYHPDILLKKWRIQFEL